MRALLTALLALAPTLWAAPEKADTVGAGEFPALQLLPEGSEVEGITLPRYDNHRVSGLLQAGKLRIISRREMELEQLHATLYNKDGSSTELTTPLAHYDFTTKRATAPQKVELRNPQFRAEGARLLFDSTTRRGVLMGPVRTSIFTMKLPHTAADR